MATFDPDKITYFAKTDARGKENTFGIKAKDRQRHMYIVGKTGMGKSTLLENMAAQDIQNGEGVAFIDPHGSAAEILLDYVPEHRIDDVVYFAPFDLDHPVSFNVLEDVGPDKRHLVVSGLMSTFKKVWVDAWSSRMEYILTNTLFALIEYPDTTLLSVSRMLSDKAYRKKVVDYVQDPAVKSFWRDEFANYTDRFAAEALPAIQNKIGQFTLNPLIRNIIGQPKSSFNIREIMDQKKILIMNLSKGLIGETNASLLGSMLTTRIYLAAMSRADLGVEEMRLQPNFYFYVDEFQSFANATFADILSEARKYHLNLIIAHQYIAQMEEEVRDAVFGNVGTTISFRVGPFDGEVLETVYAPQFTAIDLVNLGFAQIYLTLMIDGIGSQPFSAKTLPPIQRPAKSNRTQVVAQSRAQYAKDRKEVEKHIDESHAPILDSNSKNKSDKGSKAKYKNSAAGKKGGPKSGKVSNGPSTSEELKAVLAKVANEHGGGKQEEKDTENSSASEENNTNKTEEREKGSSENKSDKSVTESKAEGKAGEQVADSQKKNSNQIRISQEDERGEEIVEISSDKSDRTDKSNEKTEQEKTDTLRQAEERNLERAQRIQDSYQKSKSSENNSDKLQTDRKAAEKQTDKQDINSNKLQASRMDKKSEETSKISSDTEEKTDESSTKIEQEKNDTLRREEERNLERAQRIQDSYQKPKNSEKRKFPKEKKSKQKNELKAALAEVLVGINNKPTEPKLTEKSSSIPTVRVVKQVKEKPEPVNTKSASNTKAEVSKEDSIDIKKIKKMLKPSQPEKSPMNP